MIIICSEHKRQFCSKPGSRSLIILVKKKHIEILSRPSLNQELKKLFIIPVIYNIMVSLLFYMAHISYAWVALVLWGHSNCLSMYYFCECIEIISFSLSFRIYVHSSLMSSSIIWTKVKERVVVSVRHFI